MIVEIGSGTGKTTSEIGKLFPKTRVVGVESEKSLHEYARSHYAKQGPHLSFACASVWQPDLCAQANLKKNSADFVVSSHYLDLAHPQVETAFDNISQLLKPSRTPSRRQTSSQPLTLFPSPRWLPGRDNVAVVRAL